MKIRWTSRANQDVRRLDDFLHDKHPAAAKRIAQAISRAPDRLKEFPRIGVRLEQFQEAEIRRLVVGDYELRYELLGETIWILAVFHGREDR